MKITDKVIFALRAAVVVLFFCSIVYCVAFLTAFMEEIHYDFGYDIEQPLTSEYTLRIERALEQLEAPALPVEYKYFPGAIAMNAEIHLVDTYDPRGDAISVLQLNIYFSEQILAHESDEVLRAVLAHELAHIKVFALYGVRYRVPHWKIDSMAAGEVGCLAMRVTLERSIDNILQHLEQRSKRWWTIVYKPTPHWNVTIDRFRDRIERLSNSSNCKEVQ